MSLDTCRQKLSFTDLWSKLGLPSSDRLHKLGSGREVKLCSPFREDKNPSFSIWEAEGKTFWKDHGTGDSGDDVSLIQQARGVSQKDAIEIYHELAGVDWKRDYKGGGKPSSRKKSSSPPPQKAKQKKKAHAPAKEKAPRQPLGEPVKIYDYHDEDGNLAHQTLRYEPKTFRQRRPGGEAEAEWVWTLKDSTVYPYLLPDLLSSDKAKPVFLVEGEKDVENLLALSLEGDPITATTLPMGAGKWRDEFAEYFVGRWVVILADDDQPGMEGAQKVANSLIDHADRVSILTKEDYWPGGPAGADVSDWLEWGWSVDVYVDTQRAELMDAAGRAKPVGVEWYKESVYPGSRGGMNVREDLIARHLVAKEGLIYCGDHFWQYDPTEGRWGKKREKTWVKRSVRRVLGSQWRGDEIITDSRVNSICALARSERVKFPEQLNAHPEGTLPLKNGLLDVDTGKLHAHLPGYYITAQTPHNYDRKATCLEWIAWLRDRHDDEETYYQIQEMFGYCLFTHINYHSFFFLFGEGGTGKSTCVDVLEWLIGSENKVALELTELNNPFTRSQLVGRSLYLAKELTTSSLKHIGMIKAIVSGDPISVDVKYGDGFDFRPKGRLVMESNVIAATPDSSGGFERRFIQINWEKEFNRSKIIYGFQERFKQEMPGILNWSIEGYKRLRERGRFAHTARSEQATTDLLKHRAQVSSFLKEGWLSEVETGVEITTLPLRESLSSTSSGARKTMLLHFTRPNRPSPENCFPAARNGGIGKKESTSMAVKLWF